MEAESSSERAEEERSTDSSRAEREWNFVLGEPCRVVAHHDEGNPLDVGAEFSC